MTGLLLALFLAAEAATVQGVRVDLVGSRPAVTVVLRGDAPTVALRREGPDLVLSLNAASTGLVRVPPTRPPIEAIRLVPRADGTDVRITIAETVPYQILRTPEAVTVVVGEMADTVAPAGERAAPPPPARELYPLLFPVPSADDPAEQLLAPEGPRRDDGDGLYIGFVRFRPAVLFNYIDAETTVLDTPQPVRSRYFGIDPRLGLGLGIGTDVTFRGGRFEIRYEPRFRQGSSLAALRRPTHILVARALMPIGSRAALRASHRYARGLLETTEVDPGREYFFNLGPFIRNETEVGARFDTGSRLDLDVSGRRDRVNIDDRAGFYDFSKDRLAMAAGYALREDLRGDLQYAHERVPPARLHPVSESRTNEVSMGLDGELLPLTRGLIRGGVEDRRSPRAGPGGTHYRGWTADASLAKEFTPSAVLTLSGSRRSSLSFFEQNAFYVSSRVEAAQTFELPLYVSFRASVGQQWNRYRTVAVGLDEPRADDILGWSVGLGRSLTRWGYLRADYRRERRRSNLGAFNFTTDALVLQLGIGYVGAAPLP